MRTSPSCVTRTVVLACVLPLLLAAGCSGDGSEEPSAGPTGSTSPAALDDASDPSATPTAKPTTVKVPRRTRAQARTGVTTWIDANDTALSDPDAAMKGAGPAGMAGNARKQTINLAVEYAQNDWRVEGRAKVIRQRVIGRTKMPPTLTLEVCVDNAGVRVLDKSGKPVGLDQGSPTRSLNLVTLSRRSGDWVVTDVSFPDDPNC